MLEIPRCVIRFEGTTTTHSALTLTLLFSIYSTSPRTTKKEKRKQQWPCKHCPFPLRPLPLCLSMCFLAYQKKKNIKKKKMGESGGGKQYMPQAKVQNGKLRGKQKSTIQQKEKTRNKKPASLNPQQQPPHYLCIHIYT